MLGIRVGDQLALAIGAYMEKTDQAEISAACRTLIALGLATYDGSDPETAFKKAWVKEGRLHSSRVFKERINMAIAEAFHDLEKEG